MDERLFAELEASLKVGMAILRGDAQPSRTFVFDALDTIAIRDNLKLSQQQFANLLGINILTLQHWEQGLILGLFHDTSLEIDTDLLEMQRNLSPACKLAKVGEMNTAVKMLALAGLKSRYPDNSPEMLRRRLADLILGEELALKAYGPYLTE